jgi:phytoene/squalene synthetase
MKQTNTKVSHTAATADKLSGAVEERLRNQIGRAFRHTYGAESGLRTLVKLASSQMLAAGAAPAAVRNAIEQCLVNHPTCTTGKPSLVTGEDRSVTLMKSMLAWADETCASDRERKP